MINLKTMVMQLIDGETSGIRIRRIEGESLDGVYRNKEQTHE